MKSKYTLENTFNKSQIVIDNGELISFIFEGTEIMHQKGDPGWGSTEIEMFPIIGPTKENNFTIATPKGIAKLDQHGILRAMEYVLVKETSNILSFSKVYKANTSVRNPKFPQKSTQEFLDWPYDFEFTKTYQWVEGALRITFDIHSEIDMPLMLGFHPAFKIYDTNISIGSTESEKYSLDDVLLRGSSALQVKNRNHVRVENNGEVSLILETKGFSHFMLWTEVKNMICIEPITFYPASVPEIELVKGFDKSNGHNTYEMIISPSLV
ncbi:aldose epimerase family protein [Aquimarina pacifica]|uniref:aldose epimerase family protein n=1 Tax=Aquimarina pacifica TaxID=1296415 RepID=UPI00047137B6|nr:hypothetical protein [Aquimarina pacifica]